MIDAARVALAVRGVPGVVDLHAGPFGTASTFCTTGRIWGVRVGPSAIDVHVVTEASTKAVDLATAVRAAVRRVVDDPDSRRLPIAVHIEDIRFPGEPQGSTRADLVGGERVGSTPPDRSGSQRVRTRPAHAASYDDITRRKT